MPKRRPGVALCAAAVLFSLASGVAAIAFSDAPAQQRPAQPRPGVPGVIPFEEIERVLFESINAERAARKLPLVRHSPALTTLARKQSEDMARLGLLEHVSAAGRTCLERLEEAGIVFATGGENVARSDSFVPGPIHEALMRSGEHRKNILNPDFDEVGVGVVRAKDGIYYVTQDFIRSVALRDEGSVRAAVLGILEEARKAQGLPPLLGVVEVHSRAQLFARLKSEGKELPAVPREFGETRVDLYAGPDLDKIAAAIKKSSLGRFQMTGVGACFAPSPRFPGGAYHVCVFLLASEPAFLWAEEEKNLAILRTLNEVRAGHHEKPLELDAKLSRTARRTGLRHQKNKAAMSFPAGLAAAVLYETSSLGRLDPSLHGRVVKREYRRVGIAVIPAEAGTGLNVNYLVVLLFRD